jgi:hypothetical protein
MQTECQTEIWKPYNRVRGTQNSKDNGRRLNIRNKLMDSL